MNSLKPFFHKLFNAKDASTVLASPGVLVVGGVTPVNKKQEKSIPVNKKEKIAVLKEIEFTDLRMDEKGVKINGSGLKGIKCLDGNDYSMIDKKLFTHLLSIRKAEVDDSFETLEQIPETESLLLWEERSTISVKSAYF